MVLVTDKKYYLAQYLVENFVKIPVHLSESWDCVFIVSGHGKVRIGKSTLACQSAYFIAWLLAGGKMEMFEEPTETGKIVRRWKITREANGPVPFDMDHVVFTPKDLMETAAKLPRHSVIVYDEGRAGLESKRAMDNLNKVMEDFFQECGQYGHVLVIVLPNFFKLSEDYAVNRSLFLLDAFAIPKGDKFERGYFSFYNEHNKEMLYYFGKKKYSVASKYSATVRNFWGRFTKFFPLDKEAYDEKKKNALRDKGKSVGVSDKEGLDNKNNKDEAGSNDNEKKILNKVEERTKRYRDLLINLILESKTFNPRQLSEIFKRKYSFTVDEETIDTWNKAARKFLKEQAEEKALMDEVRALGDQV